jgi:multiple sugar transport system substrate-binding protein
VFDSPAVVEALDFIKELSQYSPPGSGNYSFGEITDAFYTGRAAAAFTLGRVLQEINSKNPSLADKFGVVQPPYSKEPFAYASWNIAQVFKEAKRKDLAKLYITKFEFDPQITLQWLNVLPGFTFSSMPAVAQLPDYINNPIRQKYPDMIKQLAIAANTGGDFTKESPKHKLNPHAGELYGGTILADVVQNVLAGGQSSKSAVTAGAKLIEALMKG